MQTLTVYLIVTPGVLMLDYAGPAEALRMARDMGAALLLHTCGPCPEVKTSLDTQLGGLAPLPERLPPNSLVLITGNSHERTDYATPAAQQVVRWLQTALLPDTRLVSICSGALLLAMAGQLDGLRCTTHHSLIADLQTLAPSAQVQSDRIFVSDGRVLTSAGITTGIDLALYLIEQWSGAAVAPTIRNSPPGWRTATTCTLRCTVHKMPSHKAKTKTRAGAGHCRSWPTSPASAPGTCRACSSSTLVSACWTTSNNCA
jgi:transcriptional regulator GlxA family with amidase domain